MSVPPHDTRTNRWRPGLAAALCCIGLSLAAVACSDDDSDGATATTGNDASTTTSTRQSTSTTRPTSTSDPVTATTAGSRGDGAGTPEEQEVIDRYVGYWDARTAANTGVPNPNDPGLAEFATGEQLEAVVAETQANLDNGLAFRPADDPANLREVRVVSITGDSAVVQECVVDDGLVIRRATGEVVNDSVTTQSVRGELQRIEGVWRLAGATVIQFWEGVAGCASEG